MLSHAQASAAAQQSSVPYQVSSASTSLAHSRAHRHETAHTHTHTPFHGFLTAQGKQGCLQDGTAIAWALNEHLIALGAYTIFATHTPSHGCLTARQKQVCLQDGTAIAWALSEHLIALGAYTIFATHTPSHGCLTARQKQVCLQDGTAIAWALSEHLIALGAYTIFATHFARLVQLEQLYPNCKAMQLGCRQQEGRVVFDWRLEAHSTQQSRYGLMLAPQACFSWSVDYVSAMWIEYTYGQRGGIELGSGFIESSRAAPVSCSLPRRASCCHRISAAALAHLGHAYPCPSLPASCLLP